MPGRELLVRATSVRSDVGAYICSALSVLVIGPEPAKSGPDARNHVYRAGLWGIRAGAWWVTKIDFEGSPVFQAR